MTLIKNKTILHTEQEKAYLEEKQPECHITFEE